MLGVKRILTKEVVDWRIRPVSDSEVKKTAFLFNHDKAAGFDGYNAHFFSKTPVNCW